MTPPKPQDAHPLLQMLMPYVVAIMGIRDRPDGLFDVVHIGSGSLFEVAGIRGVLTAGHVIEELQNPQQQFSKWAVFSFTNRDKRVPMHSFPAQHAHAVRLGENYVAMNGPDIGFIRLPLDVAGRIDRVYYNLSARYDRYASGASDVKPSDYYAMLGVIGRKSRMMSQIIDGTEIETTMMVAPCGRIGHVEENGFDYDEYTLVDMPDTPRPATYGGVSGGPVFAFSDDTSADARWIAGVVIRETPADENGHRNFITHGLLTIYGEVLDMIGNAYPDAKWPQAPERQQTAS